MKNLPAPFPPLVAGGDGLDRYPDQTPALAARMAQVYGVAAESVLPVRGLTHGLELVFRLAARDGAAGAVNRHQQRAHLGIAARALDQADQFAVIGDGAVELEARDILSPKAGPFRQGAGEKRRQAEHDAQNQRAPPEAELALEAAAVEKKIGLKSHGMGCVPCCWARHRVPHARCEALRPGEAVDSGACWRYSPPHQGPT